MAKRVKFSDEIIEHLIETEQNGDNNASQLNLNRRNDEESEDFLINQLGKRTLHVDDIEGQEEVTETRHGDTIITPFNLKEECEEGHFDLSGNFIFDKIEKEDRDAWLDSIDWQTIKEQAQPEEEPPSETAPIDTETVIKNIMSVVGENETVIGALKRLNRERGGTKKEVCADAFTMVTALIKDLTGWADALMASGYIDIYQKTGSELLKFSKASNSDIQNTWHYKWDEDSEEYGPFITQQLVDWKNAGFFDPYVLCRSASFPSSEYQRSDAIDFTQYL